MAARWRSFECSARCGRRHSARRRDMAQGSRRSGAANAGRPGPQRPWPATIRGAPGPIRTADTRFRKPVLYPLSYGGVREDILPSANGMRHGARATSSCWRDDPWRLPSRPDAGHRRHSRGDAAPRRARRASCRCSWRPFARQPCGRDGARASRTQRHR